MKFFITSLLTCCLASAAMAQTQWRNFNTDNSPLLSNQVSSILIDHDDNLWAAYADAGGEGPGVSKFDGTNWTHYNKNNSGLPNNGIRAMAVDASGNVWFGCYNAGIVKFDGTTWTRFHTGNSGIVGNNVTALQFDSNNNLWVGAYFDGISKFNGSSWTNYKYPAAPFYSSSPNCINSVTIDSQSNVWVGLDCSSGLAKLNTATNTWTKYTTASGLAHHSVSAVIEDAAGKIWIGYNTFSNVLTSLIGTTWQTISPFESLEAGVSYNSFIKDGSDIWCGAYGGLYHYNGTSWNKVTIPGSAGGASSFSQSVAVDSDHGVWWSEQTAGIWTNAQFGPAPDFDASNVLTGVNLGMIKWSDLDNDGDLDLIGNGDQTVVYENISGVFTQKSVGLPPWNGSIALGDYDNDGDQDVLIGGRNGSSQAPVQLYKNQGNFVFVLQQEFQSMGNTTMSWADIDNDQDLDFIVAGVDSENAGDLGIATLTFLYENVNGVFTELPSTGGITNCSQCVLEWADSNGDGNVDLFISGFTQNEVISAVFLNNGDKTFSEDTQSVLTQVYNGSGQWGDFDNDGDMDLVYGGFEYNVFPGEAVTFLYENIGGKLMRKPDIQLVGTTENYLGATAWLDINNDGFLDIILGGRSGSGIELAFAFGTYINDGFGHFSFASFNLGDFIVNSIDAGDYDNDGDIDIVYAGVQREPWLPKTVIKTSKLLQRSPVLNTKPVPPTTDFTEQFYRKGITLAWGLGSDSQTPSTGLSYNFYLRDGNGKQIVPPVDFTNGYQKTVNAANGNGQRGWANDMPEGDLFWAVQSVDGGRMGSNFSTEKTFYQINGPETKTPRIIDASHVEVRWYDNSNVEFAYRIYRSNKPSSEFFQRGAVLSDVTSFVDINSFITDSIYYYRVDAYNAIKTAPYDSTQVVICTPPDQLIVNSINAERLDLSWTDKSNYETHYVIERRKQGDENFVMVATLPANTIAYSDTGLQEYTYYDYRVSPQTEAGGIYSEVAGGRTNLRPQGVAIFVETDEEQTYQFSSSPFTGGFLDTDGDQLHNIQIASLPALGILKLNDTGIIIGQIIPVAMLGSIKFIPSLDLNGVSPFEVYYNDGKDNSAETIKVTISITPVNDLPVFSVPAFLVVNEDFGTQLVTPVKSAPDDEILQPAVFSIESTSEEHIVNASINSATGVITLTSIENKSGSETFHITAMEDSPVNNVYEQEITIEVAAVNDPPTFTLEETLSENEDFISELSAQMTMAVPADEVSEEVLFTITRLSTQPQVVNATITAGEKVTFTAIPNRFGTEFWEVKASEAQHPESVFTRTISVNIVPVNDPPTISVISDQQIRANEVGEVGFSVTDVDNTFAELMVTATSSNQSIVTNENLSFTGSTGNRILNIQPEAAGQSTIVVTVNDGEEEASSQFELTVEVVLAIENSLEKLVKIYPNPFVDKISIENKSGAEKLKISILDISGRIVRKFERSSDTLVQLDDLQPGIYLLRAEDGKGKVEIRKLIKRK
ncbi:MAG: VCBS repeat-containing protein [Cyclobacteriaceae bacterium]|nr:VCBS repeat-containing protein [Cyclobacteriaceae bacterium]